MTDEDQALRPERDAVRRTHSAAVDTYDRAAVVQDLVRDRLIERLDLLRMTPRVIVDVGSATGRGAAALARRYRRATVVAVDLAEPMLRRVRRHRPWLGKVYAVAGDAHALPLSDGCADMVVSNMLLHWSDDPDRMLREWHRVLRPGGVLMFSALGPATLDELRRAWGEADSAPHVAMFTDMHDVGDALVRAHLVDPVMDQETITLTYASVDELMTDLRDAGAVNTLHGRRRALTGRGRVAAMRRAYEAERDEDGRLPATFEIVYGHAWSPEQPLVFLEEQGESGVATYPGATGRRRGGSG